MKKTHNNKPNIGCYSFASFPRLIFRLLSLCLTLGAGYFFFYRYKPFKGRPDLTQEKFAEFRLNKSKGTIDELFGRDDCKENFEQRFEVRLYI